MIFHIDARNEARTEAYASPVARMWYTGNYEKVLYEDMNGFKFDGSVDDFIRDPVIIREVTPGNIYKIKLEE